MTSKPTKRTRSTKAARSARSVPSFAPGGALLLDKPRRRGEAQCPGCSIADPLTTCAACGSPASIFLPAGEHVMSLCAHCFGLVLEIRGAAQEEHERQAAQIAAMIVGRQQVRDRQEQERQLLIGGAA